MNLFLVVRDFFQKQRIFFKAGAFGDNFLRFRSSGFHHFDIFQRFHADIGHAPLLSAAQFARPPYFQIIFRQLKAVFGGSKSAFSLSVVFCDFDSAKTRQYGW